MTEARVVEIYTAADKGLPMQRVNQAYAMGGKGLQGDRYAEGRGAFSKNSRVKRHVTLIRSEDIEIANAGLEVRYTPAETRRNIVTEDIYLNWLVDKEFSIGRVVMRGVELCTPCKRPEKLSGKPGFEEAFEYSGVNFGGLRAEILTSGLFFIDDQIEVL